MPEDDMIPNLSRHLYYLTLSHHCHHHVDVPNGNHVHTEVRTNLILKNTKIDKISQKSLPAPATK